MANRIETAAVTGENIKLSSKNAGTAGSYNAVSLAFIFDDKWDGTTKKVTFFNVFSKNPKTITLTTNLLVNGKYIVPIPAEPLEFAGEFPITVRGVELNTDGATVKRVIISAHTAMVAKETDIPSTEDAPVEPTPTQAEQLQAEIDDIKGTIANAEASATAAALSKTEAQTAETNAEAAQAAAELVVSGFDTRAEGKQTDFDNNATSKTSAFNDNATAKTTSFDNNATSKTTAFNENATSKTSAFDSNAATANATIDGKVTTATSAATAAETAQQKIENMTATATTLSVGSSATVTKSVVGGVVNLEFGVPTGATGATGKTAYASAQDGGYTDTEANFYADLSSIQGLRTAASTFIAEMEALL